MNKPFIIVVGASAGGVSALQQFVHSLPADLDAAVFVVLHIPAYAKSQLPEILSKAGPLKAIHPTDGETVRKGLIYVAPNDHHLLLEGNKVLIKKGPKENRNRPSIDALFRSAAVTYGSNTVGIVLSGLLNDGTSGLWAIKRHGGIAIIQSPDDAEYGEMPNNVNEYVTVDHMLPAAKMGGLLQTIISEQSNAQVLVSEEEVERLKTEVLIAKRDNAFNLGIMEMGEYTPFTCPECHGALVRLVEGNLIRFRCHTGHAYTASSLLASVTETVEEILWQGMRGMEEVTMLLTGIADHFEKLNNPEAALLFREKSTASAKTARVIHDSLFAMEQYSEDIRFEKRSGNAGYDPPTV